MTELFNLSKHTDKRRDLRKTMPKGEDIVWQKIRGKKLDYKFRRQFGIGNITVDFYCPKPKLVVEVDGYSHMSEESQKNDVLRDKYCGELGLVVKRYTSTQVFHNLAGVLIDIQSTCEDLAKQQSP